MSKRRLTDQQKERIQNKQKDILAAYELHGEASGYKKAQVIAKTRSTAIITIGNNQQISAKIRQGIDPVACGDYILWQETPSHSDPIIPDQTANKQQEKSQDVALVAILPRKTVLQRPTSHGPARPFAANIDCIIIVMAHKPAPRPELLDRYLVIAEAAGIRPVLVFNKCDLLEISRGRLPEFLNLYTDLGYTAFATSAKEGAGLDALMDFIGEQCVVFAGQSGVGKSTLIQYAVPDQEIQTGQLSANMKGRHTTSTSILYNLPTGGQLIDTPGVRDIAVWHLDEPIVNQGFIEFAPFFGRCKFSDCQHTHEPNCALKEAILDHKISQRRFNSYLTILNSDQ